MSSYWIESTAGTSYPQLDGDLEVDVAIIGGGITGVTAALLLKRAGKRVALLEMKRIARGATGYTTAKLTSGHNVIYSALEQTFGANGSRVYAEANQAGLQQVRSLAEELGIDCDLEPRANYVYAGSAEAVFRIEEEVKAARRAGLAVSLVKETSLPYPVAAAARLENQAQFHPRKYVLGLAEAVPGDGSHVFEQTRARDVRQGELSTVLTQHGVVRARHVIVATHLPFEDSGLYFAKTHPQRSYAIAFPIGDESAPDGMFISADQPTRSLRTAPRDGGRLLIVGGEGHKTGQGDAAESYGRLEAWARGHFAVELVPYRWATHDYVSIDRVPFVGPLLPWRTRVWVATGYGKWGMTNGTAAALILADLVLERKNPWAELFSSRRVRSLVSRSFVRENANVVRRLVGDRLKLPGREAIEALAPGEGAVVRVEGETLAVSRSEDGSLAGVSPRCTHLGCHVGWNNAERTWDCPCHGSRYLPDGSVIEGPAVRDLATRQVAGSADSSTRTRT
jgi:glycine/D-amino acid oxidase-like deaminating enzyme/nitrite reductase/ring-hydroxylating ferredoxin subunit